MTPKSPSEIARDTATLILELKNDALFPKACHEILEKLIATERSEADKLQGEIEVLKSQSGPEHDAIVGHMNKQIENLRQQLADAKGDCHCGESHRLKLQLYDKQSIQKAQELLTKLRDEK